MFRLHPETKEMYLETRFPGYPGGDIKANVLWELKMAQTLSHFPILTDKEPSKEPGA